MLKLVLIIFLTLILFPPKYKIRNNIKIIIYLIGIIYILQNIEGFGTGIDGQPGMRLIHTNHGKGYNQKIKDSSYYQSVLTMGRDGYVYAFGEKLRKLYDNDSWSTRGILKNNDKPYYRYNLY